MVKEVSEQLAENEMALRYCHLVEKCVSLFEFLYGQETTSDPPNDVQTALGCPSYEAEVISKVVCDNTDCDMPEAPGTFGVQDFIQCLSIKTEQMAASDSNEVRIHHQCRPIN